MRSVGFHTLATARGLRRCRSPSTAMSFSLYDQNQLLAQQNAVFCRCVVGKGPCISAAAGREADAVSARVDGDESGGHHLPVSLRDLPTREVSGTS